MNFLLYTYLFIFGLIFGSFYNVVGIRLSHGESIVHPRSHCPYCGHTLTAKELVPVFSWIVQKGRCRNCGVGVSPKYALFELLTASLFTISPIMTGWSKDLLLTLVLISLVVIIIIAELDSAIIPVKVLMFFGVLSIVLRIFIPTSPWWDGWIGAIIGYVLISAIGYLLKSRKRVRYAQYAALLGLFTGALGIILAVLAALIASAAYIAICVSVLKNNKKTPYLFSTLLGISALLVFLVIN